MVAQRSLVLLAAIFAAARSQAPVGGPHGRPHVARYLRGEGREDEEAPALHYFATDPEWKYVAVRRTASEPVELFDVASESDKPVARFAFKARCVTRPAGPDTVRLGKIGFVNLAKGRATEDTRSTSQDVFSEKPVATN